MRVSPKVFMSEERQQSLTRLGLSVSCFLLLSALIPIRGQEFTPLRIAGLSVIALHFAFAMVWHQWIRLRPEQWARRIRIALMLDITSTTVTLAAAGSLGSYFYPVFLWVVVGYGLRYGPSYLLQAMVAGCIGFGLTLKYSHFWSQNLDVGIGLAVGILVLPSFFITVLKRLNRLNIRLGEQLERAKAAE